MRSYLDQQWRTQYVTGERIQYLTSVILDIERLRQQYLTSVILDIERLRQKEPDFSAPAPNFIEFLIWH
jgi:hypothetical protein